MPKIDLGRIVTAAIAAAATQAASSPTTELTQKDVPQVVDIAHEAVKPAVREAQARIDYIASQESLPTSWSFNAAVLAVVSSCLTIYGALADGYVASADNIILIGAGGTLLSAAGWLIGRIRGKPIGQ